MLSELLKWHAITQGFFAALKPIPKVPPQAIGIWWCHECNAWRPYSYHGEEAPVCNGDYSISWHKSVPMRCEVYTPSGAMPAVLDDAHPAHVPPMGVRMRKFK